MKREIVLNKGEGGRIVRERKYKSGYVIRDEYWLSHLKDKPEGHAFLMTKQAYNLNGAWIGDSKWAYRLSKKGILPELADTSSSVCSVGFNKEKKYWYGWSHRAINGFTYGNMLFDENWYPSDGTGERDSCGFLKECETIKFTERGSIKITDMRQARQAAVNFAEYVS